MEVSRAVVVSSLARGSVGVRPAGRSIRDGAMEFLRAFEHMSAPRSREAPRGSRAIKSCFLVYDGESAKPLGTFINM